MTAARSTAAQVVARMTRRPAQLRHSYPERDTDVDVTASLPAQVVGHAATPPLRQVAAAYQETRAWARWRTTFRLRRYESRASGRAQPGVSDQLYRARVKAVRDELASRGKLPAPGHRGLP